MLLVQRLLAWLRAFEATICVVAFAGAAIALIADVLGREFFGSGIFGAQRFAVWATAIAGLVGFALVTADGGHLRPRFADGWLPKAMAPIIDRLSDLISALILIGLGVYAVDFVLGSYRLGEVGLAIRIPIWPIQIILPWMFFSSALRHLAFAAWPVLRPTPSGEGQ